jgi:hypothetical protein
MSTNPVNQSKATRERNIVTMQRHRREMWLQITLPLVIGIFILLVFSVLVVLGENSDIRRWADISMIWLIIPAMFFTFIGLLLLAGSVYLTVYLIIELPFLSYRFLLWLRSFQGLILNLSDRIVEPFFRIEGFKASVNAAARGLRSARNNPSNGDPSKPGME